MATLATKFLGMSFANPFLLASGPPAANGAMLAAALEAGWGGVVTKTIGLEPTPNPSPRVHIVRDGHYLRGMVNIELISEWTIERWEQDLDVLRQRFPEQPVIASIMGGGRAEDWQEVVYRLQRRGVSGFEMNVSCPNFAAERGAQLGQDPESLALAVGWVRAATRLPVIVKLTPNVTDIVTLARVAMAAGADAITATNTLSGMAGIDLETFAPLPSVGEFGISGGYSGPALKPVSLRCAASIAQSVAPPLLGCGGINMWRDAAEFIAVGASVVEVCTAVMWNGCELIERLCRGLWRYLDEHKLASPEALRGRALAQIVKWPDLDLSVKLLAGVDNTCNGCGNCVKACDSGGYQAIRMVKGLAIVNPAKCDGCGLCVGVCPQAAIGMGARAGA